MNIEEVREHFKDAKVVECLGDKLEYLINEKSLEGLVEEMSGSFYIDTIRHEHGCGNIRLHTSKKGFAKIIEYKTKPTECKSACDLYKSFHYRPFKFDELGLFDNSKLIDIPKGMEIDQVTFKKIEKQLPNSWLEFLKINTIEFGMGHALDKYHAMRRLELLRDCYNDGWKADWSDTTEYKYCVFVQGIGLIKYTENRHSYFLNFKTAELRDKFLENFKDIIEIAKPLL